MKLLLPFVWPRGSILLQLCVMACVALLVAGRVVNLYTPLYYKKIGKNSQVEYKKKFIDVYIFMLYKNWLNSWMKSQQIFNAWFE